MSGAANVVGGLPLTVLQRHYELDDFIPFPFTAVQDYYTVGTMAFLSDPNIINVQATKGWTLFDHKQAAAPAWFAVFGLPPVWPAPVPAFEAKQLMFLSDQPVYVRFELATRVQHLIPANVYVTIPRRCFMFFVQRAGANNGTLNVWMLG